MNRKKNRYVAVIPARKGSRRLYGKNMLKIAGKPMVQWSIEAALESKSIDRIVVSSDDKKVLELAKRLGAETIERPAHLATDTATTFDTVAHAIRSLEELPEYTVLLQPTSPLRSARHVDEAIALLEEREADGVISVCETEHSPLWSNILPEDGSMQGFLKEEILNKRGQDLPAYYRLNGAIYVIQSRKLLETGSFFLKEHLYAYIMERESSVDVDSRVDFLVADYLLKNRTVSPHEQF
ncbi:cytidylyltransferase domain-containing protein [Hydrogenimonas urashimensis]|uniref:acylneuraminate cytidylyltransferase family protein n=1 Tax=Hydrogenimonas urashimensis TaxID=2740515 RepID=UPI0019165EB2|nr:acylneuraminate cytidylyltransferase family protein [Hydrogenimonas urashimensis]